MKFVGWLVLGLLLGPSISNFPQPSWFSTLAQIAGGIFLFFAGWELKFLDLWKDRRFYLWNFLGAFGVPFVAGYLYFNHNLFMAIALGLSALPVAIQILKEKKLYDTALARRAITLASLCDIVAWVVFAFLLPEQRLSSWILSHWIVLAFFLGLFIGKIRELRLPDQIMSLQMWVLAPLFFVGLGWKIDIVSLFSWAVFVETFLIAIISKSLGVYIFSRFSKVSFKEAWNLAALLNARGAMEVLAAHYAYQSGLIDGNMFAALVVVGISTSVMAAPALRR
ncbi:MAG: cation:proton antiporter [Bdellovibrio sp.]|nr:cation:proton antiporter [Bdellovibrio sp.]